ncbi:hypothetical protein D9M68_421990 [compost metagenome]
MALGSASGSTMPASLPPSSSVSRFMVLAADCITFLPVAQEPVNTILRMTGSDAMSAPRFEVRSSQLTLLTTPSGSTSLSSSTKRSVASGVYGEGLMTTVLPVRSAGSTCHTAISTGKFHGVIEPTTPTGLRKISTWPCALSCSTRDGNDSAAVAPAQAAAPPSSQRDPRPLSGLPCSSVSRRASSSACAPIFSVTARQAAASSSSDFRDQLVKAFCAAATAAARSSREPFGAVPITWPLAGLRTSKEAVPGTARPPIVILVSCIALSL